MPTKAILFFFSSSEVNSTWLITSELTNQRAWKALFTCVVYTYHWHSTSLGARTRWAKRCSDICPRKLSVPRSEQFSESVARGGLWASRNRLCPKTNFWAHFQMQMKANLVPRAFSLASERGEKRPPIPAPPPSQGKGPGNGPGNEVEWELLCWLSFKSFLQRAQFWKLGNI